MPNALNSFSYWPLVIVMAALVMLYLVGRMIGSVSPRRLDGPQLRAVLVSVMVLIIGAAAIASGRPGLALHLPIATAVCALTLGVAAALLSGSENEPPVAHRSWALLTPAVVMILLTSLHGRIDGVVAVSLIVFGFFAAHAWDQRRLEPDPGENASQVSHASWLLLPLLALVALAGWMLLLVLPALDKWVGRQSDSAAAVFLIAPFLVAPVVLERRQAGRHVTTAATVSTLALLTLACLCFVLPMVTGIATLQRLAADPTILASTTQPVFASLSIPATATRADIAMLLASTLVLVPASTGLYRLGRIEGAGLAVLYVLYLLLVWVSTL